MYILLSSQQLNRYYRPSSSRRRRLGPISRAAPTLSRDETVPCAPEKPCRAKSQLILCRQAWAGRGGVAGKAVRYGISDGKSRAAPTSQLILHRRAGQEGGGGVAGKAVRYGIFCTRWWERRRVEPVLRGKAGVDCGGEMGGYLLGRSNFCSKQKPCFWDLAFWLASCRRVLFSNILK